MSITSISDSPIVDTTACYDFVVVVEANNTLPNGDPDADNTPRILPDGRGTMTDVSAKRKVRDYWSAAHNESLFVERGVELSSRGEPRDFIDGRVFGAPVFGTSGSGGEKALHGPTQVSSLVTVTPVDTVTTTITVMARHTAEAGKDNKNMGSRSTIVHGLYVGEGRFSPALAEKTRCTTGDLTKLWEALVRCWETTGSATRDLRFVRLLVAKHDNPLRSAAARNTVGTIRYTPTVDRPISVDDYTVTGPELGVAGVTWFEVGYSGVTPLVAPDAS